MPDSSLRIAFAGTPDFAARHLQGLIDAQFNVVAVLTQPDRPVGRGKKIQPTPVKAVATEHGIPVMQPQTLDSDAIDALRARQPDVLVVVAYGLLLSQAVLDIPRFGCINVHASLLPRWRGAAPVERAILAGDAQTGVSIMQMDAGLDTGDVLLRLPTPVADTDNAATVGDRLVTLGIQGLVRVLTDLPTYQAGAEKQDAALATYAAKLTKDDARIDWHASAMAIQHQVQAFYPRSPAWCWFQGERLRLIAATSQASTHQAEPGTILAVTGDALQVACGSDILSITAMQLPGKKPAAFKDIRNGHPSLFAPGGSLAAHPPAQ